MPTTLSPETYPQLMNLINLTYRDRVEQITAAQVNDDGNIIAVALDGRKKLAVKITDNDISIKLIGESAAFAKAGPKSPKKKNCKEGSITCGFTCISGKKVCRIGMSLEQQKAYKELKSKAKIKNPSSSQNNAGAGSGDAPIAPAGKLTTVPKPESKKEEAKRKTINEQIDDKYASANPSDEDVANWVKERIKAHFEPTPENVAQRAVLRAQWELGLYDRTRSDIEYGKFSNRIKDRDSYAKANVAYLEWERKKDPESLKNRASAETWFQSIRSPGRLSNTELSKVQKQVVKGSVAAQKKLAKHNKAVAAEPAERARAEELAAREREKQDRLKSIRGRRREEHLNGFREEFDRLLVTQEQEMEKPWELIKAGQQSALKNAREEVLSVAGIPRQANPSKPGTFLPIQDSDIKEHLIGLAKNRDTEMFSGATKAEVRKQYRELAAKFHPDNQATGDEKEFRRVTDAYNQKLKEFD